jgi:hypothetical protein
VFDWLHFKGYNEMRRTFTYLTVRQVKAACEKHQYLLLRHASGSQVAINSRISKVIEKKGYVKDHIKTIFVGYLPCDFQTYITKKVPFI